MESTNQTAGGVQKNLTTPVLAGVDRVKFWADTCREVTQMSLSSKEAMDLYRKYGCRFWAATETQVDEVLKALDAGLPQWEKTYPELFFQTLELNFPELVKRTNFGNANTV